MILKLKELNQWDLLEHMNSEFYVPYEPDEYVKPGY